MISYLKVIKVNAKLSERWARDSETGKDKAVGRRT